MKKIILIPLLLLAVLSATAQTSYKPFDFGYYLRLMQYGAKGISLEAYKKHAAKLGLNLIHHAEEKSEIYLVWAEDVSYKTGYMSESYASVGDHPRCLNMDLTPNGKNRYTPIGITLVFPDEQTQQEFWRQGMNIGCQEVTAIEPTDVDATWSHVRELRYIGNPKTQVSWRYIFFYQKDNLFMCTFFF